MLQGALLVLAASILASAHAAQAQLQSSHRWDNPQGILSGDERSTQWSLDESPSPNVTDHLVFETAYSLLQLWPNSRMISGHNIVPGIIPEGTLLYHGTSSEQVPPGPDWVALDPEHAHYYCRERTSLSSTQRGCWQLTLTTIRPLKVVYFDGKSAGKSSPGAMDTQDLLVFGELLPANPREDGRRAKALCEWGQNFGVDGFVRQQMSFEVILCSFTSGVNIVTFSNIVQGFGLPSDISDKYVMFEVTNAGAWHNRLPGETRVQLDLTGLISFYDTELVPSLVAIRADQERRDHRAGNASKEDLSAVVSRLEEALTRPSGLSSAIEWKTLLRLIIDRHAGRFELIQHLLSSSLAGVDNILDLAVKIQTQLRVMLTPYIDLSATSTDWSDETVLDWTVPIYRDCATAHTKYAESRLDSMTESEKLLLRAIRGTNREICRVVTKMWASGVHAGIDFLLNTKESADVDEVTRIWNVWVEDLDLLMAWLDWNVWVKCKPGCSSQETCFLGKWPFQMPHPWDQKSEGWMESRLPEPDGSGAADGEPARPHCVSLVDP